MITTKTIGGMAIAAVVLTIGAVTLDTRRASAAAWQRADTLLFPDLRGKIDSVEALVIESASGTTTLERDGDAWTVTDRGGYAGRGDEVGRILVALAEAELVEPKTSDPERYEKLGLTGFEDEASQTVRVTVKGSGDSVLADVFIGARRRHGAGEGWYVRQPDDDVTWAAQAKLRTPKRVAEWLQTELFDVARDRIDEVHVLHKDGDEVQLVRATPEATAFEIGNLPEGREPRSERSGATFLGSLASLRLQDVRPRDDDSFPAEPDAITTWWTSDGLRVTARLAEVDEELLCRFDAEFDPSHSPDAAMGPVPDPETDDAGAPAPIDIPGADGPDADPKTPEEVEAEAAEIRAMCAGWTFVLPSWKKTSFLTSMEELLKELPEPEEDDEEAVEPPPTTEEAGDDGE